MGPRYPWVVVGLLWFCGFFNYADRQAVFSVFPLLKDEFGLSNEQKGLIGSAFMLVYALSAPLAGFVVDRTSRRFLIVVGLAFWSLVCAATALARTFNQLLFFRAAEGLGETFYFPASMSLLADYHGPRTRSRAMSIHQTSVYAGTALGGIGAGYLGANFGWRSPFWALGLVGLVYAGWLASQIVEPVRSRDEDKPDPGPDLAREEIAGEELAEEVLATARPNFGENLAVIFRTPAAVMLLAVFGCANFVAAVFLTWLTDFVYTKFGLSITYSAIVANIFTLASLVGALSGGVFADLAARWPGGRIRVQALGLFVGAPFIYMVGTASTIPLLIVGMIAVGLSKGFYDANIFASVYDVVPAKMRGTTAGLMNTIGWAFASIGPWAIGRASDRYGLSAAIGSIAGVYVLGGVLALVAASLAARRQAGAR
jgi:MFS family permease